MALNDDKLAHGESLGRCGRKDLGLAGVDKDLVPMQRRIRVVPCSREVQVKLRRRRRLLDRRGIIAIPKDIDPRVGLDVVPPLRILDQGQSVPLPSIQPLVSQVVD